MNLNLRLDEVVFHVPATSMVALDSTPGDAVYVSLKGYERARITIDVLNATTVTGGVVTLKQATAVAGTNEKALAFTRMLADVDVAALVAYVETAVTSNTFTTNTTNSKRLCYIIDVRASDLDVAGGFDCIRVDVASMANAIGLVSYDLCGAKYSGASPMAD